MQMNTRRMARLLDALCHCIALSVGVAVLLTVAVVSYGVLAREVLKLSDVWVTEITTYLMAYMTFVGTATLAWQGRHLKVDVLGQHFGPRTDRVLELVSCAIVTAVAVILFWLSLNFWLDAWGTGERSWGMFSIALWIPYSSLLVGSGLLVIVQAARFVKLVVTMARVNSRFSENDASRVVVRH